jgi:hypothetical protein
VSAGPPLWLKVVYRLERAIGEPIEAAVHSDTYFDAVAEAMRLRARIVETVEGVSRRCLHLVNLPAGTDVRRVREQLGRMERRLEALGDELAALQAPAASDSTEPAGDRNGAAGAWPRP